MARARALTRTGRGPWGSFALSGAAPLLLLALGPWALVAQSPPEGIRFELRVDANVAARDIPAAVHVGAGAARRFGMLQVALLAGAGPAAGGVSGRAETAARFHVDPFRERRWGLYGSAGGGVHWADTTEPFLLLLLGLEGPRRASGWSPIVEAGFSRGVRLAVGVRRTPPRRR